MTDTLSKVRHNYWAILVAAVACFLLEGVWYTIFEKAWLEGTGRTNEWLMDPSNSKPLLQYGTAFVSTAVMAIAISCVTQLTGAQTALRGVKTGVLLWLGFVLTTWATEYAFEVRPLSLLGINAGVWLLGVALMGAIVGGWKRK